MTYKMWVMNCSYCWQNSNYCLRGTFKMKKRQKRHWNKVNQNWAVNLSNEQLTRCWSLRNTLIVRSSQSFNWVWINYSNFVRIVWARIRKCNYVLISSLRHGPSEQKHYQLKRCNFEVIQKFIFLLFLIKSKLWGFWTFKIRISQMKNWSFEYMCRS